jgi:hypothetical protein
VREIVRFLCSLLWKIQIFQLNVSLHNWKLTAETLARMKTNSSNGVSRPTAAATRLLRSVEQRTGNDRVRNENVQR